MAPPSEAPGEPRRRAPRGLAAAITLCVAMGSMAGMAALVRYGPDTAVGRSIVERLLDGLNVGRFGRLGVQGLSGDPWRDPSVAHLTLSDRSGVWLDIRDIALRWRPAELLRRRLSVETLAARAVTVLRRPILSAEVGGRGGPPPLSIRVDSLSTRLEAAPAFAYRRGVYDVRGALDIERSGLVRGWLTQTSVLHLGDRLWVRFDVEPSKAFRIEAAGAEGRGGALAGMAGLTPTEPFQVAAHAQGSLAAGQIFVDTRLGALRPIEVQGAWTRDGGSAHGTIQLAASSLLARYAAMIGPVGAFDVQGRSAGGRLADLHLTAGGDNLALTARGLADIGRLATGPAGLAIDARVTDPNRIVTVTRIGPAHLAGTLSGDARHWSLAGVASAEGVGDDWFNLARVFGPVSLERRDGDLLVSASASGAGGAGKGLVAALLGAQPRAAADLTVFGNGRLLIRKLSVTGPGLTVNASGDRSLLGALAFKGDASLSNLAVAHAGAHGLVKADWAASQGSASRPWSFSLDARGDTFAAGLGEADRLLGATPRLRVAGAIADGGVEVSSATLDGAAGAATGAGHVGADALALKLAWRAAGPFGLGPIEIDGQARGSGDITGTLKAPRADLLADFSTIDLPGLPLRAAHLVLTFAGAPSGADGHLALTASSDYGPAQASGAFRFEAGGVDLSNVEVRAGGASATGSVALRRGEPSLANLTVGVGPGAFLAEGHADARLKVEAGPAGRRASLSLTVAGGVLRQGGLAVRSLELTADGPLARLPWRGRAQGTSLGGPWRLSGGGVLARSGADRVLDFTGAGRVQRADLRTLSPAEIRLGPRGMSAKGALAIGSGRADINVSRQKDALTGKATLTGVSLALFDEDLVGEVSGTASVAGRGGELSGAMQAKLAGAGGRDLRGSPPVDGQIDARLAGGTVVVTGRFGNAEGLEARGDMTLPVATSASPFRIAVETRRPISGQFSVKGELKPLWQLAMGGTQSLDGKVAASGTLAGTLADPRATGSASLDGGHFLDADTGLRLQDITLRATMADNAVDVSRFSATDGAKGTVAGAGRASLTRDGASSFHVDLARFRLIDNDLAHATASGRVTVNRAADGKVQLAGAVTVDRAQISPNPPVATGVVPMEVVEIHRSQETEESVAAPPSRDAPLGLDVTIKAANGVFVKGRGLNLELSLDAHVGGTTAAPRLSGAARVVRGDYDFAGQRFQFDDRGVIWLGATTDTIRLDLTATREDPTLTAVVKIAGTAAKPTITLSSTPALPQDEILSQVLFGTSAAQLTGGQAAQLASTLAGLSRGGGFDVIGGLRSFAHLDRLAIGGTAVTGTTVAGGKYITDKLYLELVGGGREGQEAQLEWRMRKHLSLVGKLGSEGDSQIALRWRKDY